MPVSFIHLRAHSEFSLSNGLLRIKPTVKRLVELDMPALALTDQSNLCALIKFYKACRASGVKPLIGVDLWFESSVDALQQNRITLLAMNDTGYRNMTELISDAYVSGQSSGFPRVDKVALERKSEGLIALMGGRDSEISQALVAEKQAVAAAHLDFWKQVYPNRFYIELQRTGRSGDEHIVHDSVALAAAADVPVVATNDVHFLSRDDYEAHETRVCIADSDVLDDPRRERRYSEEQYLKSSEEMLALFKDIPEALENSVEIAKRCNVELHLGECFLPQYPVPESLTMDEFFKQICLEGLESRLDDLFGAGSELRDQKYPAYVERLDFELDIILQMGFPGYFLIVMDFIQWAKNHDIPVGPGRGSGAGSLVAYALKITDLDPIGYDLLFERFLNPERVSMPDFDVDFCMDGRDRVIAYVADHYGRDAVSQIITFGTMAAKAVVRDVARVQGKSYGLADKLSKLIPFEVGMTLNKAIEQEEALSTFLAQDEEAQEIWEMALKLEGVTRNVGKHAGGVVIAPTRLTDFSPLYCDDQGEGLVTQFDKNDVEDAGLVKFDFLGLRTLTIVDWALKMINPKRLSAGEEALDIDRIPLDDPASFKLLKTAETTAVFQLESRGMKDLIRRLQPDNLEDMIALVALFRPGPLESGMVDDFINRKHGRAQVAYPHPDFQHDSLKGILEPTYGVIVYQEQVMQIAQTLAGYTLGGADLLRRAMGKKKPEEMAKQREIFKAGSIDQGVEPELAMKIFDLVEKFAGYGFNKSHSAAYALVSYQTLWLKTHYPAEFMAAVLTADMQNTDKVVALVEECRKLGLELVLPDVNLGQYVFTVDDQGRIVYGLGAIKGLGEGPVESVLEARQEGPFSNLFDFCDRVDLKRVNKRALEALIYAGAFDAIGPTRARLFASIEEAVQRADQNARNEAAGMSDLFGEVVPDVQADVYERSEGCVEWSDKQRLEFEKETLGLYLTGHPFDTYESEVRCFAKTAIQDLKPGKGKVKVSGLIHSLRVMKTKRGQNMCSIVLDDRSGRIEVTVFSEAFDAARELIQKDEIIVVEGVVATDDYSGDLRMRANEIYSLVGAREHFSGGLAIDLHGERIGEDFMQQFAQWLQPYRSGRCPVRVNYVNQDASAVIALGEDWHVIPSDDLLQVLKHHLGEQRVQLEYHAGNKVPA